MAARRAASRTVILAAMSLPILLAVMPAWVTTTWSVLLLLAGFSLVIFVHEMGHFLAAKWADVRVEQFAIGFGRELAGFTKGETRYSLNLLPLGGYVKMLGQEDFVIDKSGELKVKQDPRSFTNKSIGQRMVIVSAGVIMNLLFATVAFAIVVMVGRPEAPAIIGGVLPDSPAGRAGLEPGDKIVAVNGKETSSFGDLKGAIVLCTTDEVVFEVVRNGKRIDPIRLQPEFKKSENVRQVGITPGTNRRVRTPSFYPREAPGPNEMIKDDELYQLVIDGQPKEFKDVAPFRRAAVEARGNPIDAFVKRPKDAAAIPAEMLFEPAPNIESTIEPVKLSAIWCPLPSTPNDPGTASLLGLVPRLSVLFIEAEKSFDKAGLKMCDVITSIAGQAYPTHAQVRAAIESSPGKAVPISVARTRMANGGLSWRAVEFCVLHREALIAAALLAPDKAMALANETLAKSDVPAADREALLTQFSNNKTADGWRHFLEKVDVHDLKLTPKAQFTLFSKTPPPKVDGLLMCLDDDHLVVADVLDQLGDVPSPAKKAAIPIGAVIVAADGKPVSRWAQLCEVFRTKVGSNVELTYRVAHELRKARIDIPDCMPAALNLPVGARVTKIDGKTSVMIKNADGEDVDVSLPDWQAIKAISRGSIGRKVTVEYTTAEGLKSSGVFDVRADNVDPWLSRVAYQEAFACYPLFERHSESNPFTAAWIGFNKAYDATVQTVLSIRHIAFTRKVGVENVSGPIGIMRLGSEAAEAGLTTLLFFLALISANLAVINFLPMPIVDGGLFLFLILEKIRGEPVSIKTQIATQVIGIALIVTLFVLVSYQDIKRWVTGT
jgi:membrane-associated protease RseP (regulator of RpoE activity)